MRNSIKRLLKNKSTSNIYTKRLKNRTSLSGGVTVDRSVAIDRIRQSSLGLSRDILKSENKNLILWSEDISNAIWTISNVTKSSNTVTAPDGTLTGDTIMETAVSGSHFISQVVASSSGITYRMSAYVKYNGRPWVLVGINSGSQDRGTAFNIFNGTIGTTIGTGTNSPTIENAGNGWYRCSVTVVSGGNINTSLAGLPDDGSINPYLGDITKGYYIWGQQLELGTQTTPYQATQTVPITRLAASFVYNPSSYGEGKNYSVYPQLNNLIKFSEEFDNAAWIKGSTGISQNVIVNPVDGLSTADKITVNSTTSTHTVGQALTTIPNNTYTFSIYLKAAEMSKTLMSFTDGIGNTQIEANLTTGTITFGSGVIQNAGNGWYRISLSRTISSTSTSSSILIYVEDNSGNTNYLGDGTSGFYSFGAQLEKGSTATTYQRTTDGIIDFQFTRATNATVTNKDGLIGDSCYNLISNSEAFNTHVVDNGTVTADSIISPVDTVTADLYKENTSTGNHGTRVGVGSISGTYTLTTYLKYAGRQWVALVDANNSATCIAFFDVLNGVVGNVGSAVTSTYITLEKNGFYKCSFTFTATSTFSYWLSLRQSNGGSSSYLGDGASGVYAWGAQLAQGQLRDYLKTTNRLAVPRIDYSLDLTKPSLLIEPQRTNSLLQSETFSSNWVGEGALLVGNSAISPSGANNATKLNETTSNAGQDVYQIPSGSAGTYTSSVFAKAGERNRVSVYTINNGGTDGARAIFNLSTGVIDTAATIIGSATNASSKIVSVGNGWYRCSVTATLPAGTTVVGIVVGVRNTNDFNTYVGTNGFGVYIYGAQVEVGSNATTYIPTTTATVTRNAETSFVDLFNNNILNKDNFTLYAEGYLYDGVSTGNATIGLSDNINGISGANNYIMSFDKMRFIYKDSVGGGSQTLIGTNISNNSYFKFAIQRNGTAVKFFQNGSQVGTTQTIPTFDYRYLIVNNGGNTFTINKIEMYRETLPDATLLIKTI